MEVEINGFKMAYSEKGQGIPLLFIHGYPLNRKMWQPQLDGLSEFAHILAIDLRGHGDTQSISGPYSMDLFADDLNAFLDNLGIHKKIILCGLSMGGYIAFAFFRKYSLKLSAMILSATRAAADSPEARTARDQSAKLAINMGVEAIVEGMLPRMLSPTTILNKPELVEQLREIMLHTSLEGVLGDLVGLKNRPDSTPTLAQIDLPVLVIAGEDDQIIPLFEVKAMHAALPSSRLVTVPEAGHLPNLENPIQFNQAIIKFLSEINE